MVTMTRRRLAALLAATGVLLAGCGAAGATEGTSAAPAAASAPADGTSATPTGPPATGGMAPGGMATGGMATGGGALPVYTPAAEGKVVYLTFDDGPDPTFTPKVLDVLKENDARGTFFVVGRYVRRHPELLARAVAEGSSVQSHSNTHPQLIKLDDATVTDVQLRPVSILIRKATGVVPTCLRPPYGDYDARVQRLAGGLGLRIAMWDVDTLDWKNPGPQAIADRALAQVAPGAVILMHDGGADRTQTVAALRILLPRLTEQGYRFGVMCREA